MKSSFELLCNLTFVVMNSDEQFSDNVDKQMLIQLVNENVTHPFRPKNSKNPRCLTLRGFFFVLTIQCRFNVYSMLFASRLLLGNGCSLFLIIPKIFYLID